MAEPEAEEPRPMWKQLLSAFVKQMILLMVISSVMKNLMPSNPSGNKTGELGGDKSSTSLSKNLFSQNQLYDVYFYLDEEGSSFNGYDDPKKLLWVLKSLKYGDWNHGPFGDGSYIFDATFPTPEVLLRNQSLFLHVFAIESGLPINPEHLNYDQDKVIYEVNKLNKFRKKVYKKTANLWTGKSEQSDEEQAKARIMDYEVLNFWHPNISINLLQDFSQWQKGAIPSPINKDIKFTKDNKYYKPVIFFNTFWNLASDYMPINRTVKELQLTITFYPFSLVKYQVYSSQKAQTEWENMMPGSNDEETGRDQIKQAILETNPILLSVTLFVSILHSVFEFLAFKNDIQFWKNRRDLVGLSVRSVLFNVLQSIIVFLYICDNETNFMVKVSVFASLLVESWKIPKVLDIQINNEAKFFGIIPKISFKDKGSYVESETKVYDEMAFKYLRWVLLPLLVGYAVYSIVYVEQKGWYSWILNVLYGYFLTFGFITMTPQLFINYKLKSVAHLPWRMLTYKFINTFIDDLFAFVIKMPLLYRLGCFRDDIIFIIYLYQRWIYRVDPTRINEYGTSGKNKTVEVVEETKKTK